MNLEAIKNKLERERDELKIILQSYENELQEILKEPVSSTDEMADRYELKEESHLRKEILESRLATIEKALKKIDDGTYGVCEKCGQPIEEARLKIDPAVLLCRKCSIR
jgi:RNA polymerase-binding transcription factor DksA